MDLREEAEMLKKLIQDEIVRKGLVSSGTLRDSIKVTLSTNGIQISAVDYFFPLDAKFNILEDVKKTSEYKTIINNITKAIIAEALKK